MDTKKELLNRSTTILKTLVHKLMDHTRGIDQTTTVISCTLWVHDANALALSVPESEVIKAIALRIGYFGSALPVGVIWSSHYVGHARSLCIRACFLYGGAISTDHDNPGQTTNGVSYTDILFDETMGRGGLNYKPVAIRLQASTPQADDSTAVQQGTLCDRKHPLHKACKDLRRRDMAIDAYLHSHYLYYPTPHDTSLTQHVFECLYLYVRNGNRSEYAFSMLDLMK